MYTDTFFNKNNEFQYFIYIDTKFVLVVNFRSDSDTHTTARHKGHKKILLSYSAIGQGSMCDRSRQYMFIVFQTKEPKNIEILSKDRKGKKTKIFV